MIRSLSRQSVTRVVANVFTTFALLSGPALASPLNPSDFSALGSLNLAANSGVYVFDTGTGGAAPTLKDAGNSVLFTGIVSNGISIFDFSSVFIGTNVNISAVGPNPLALLSQTNIQMNGILAADGQKGADAGGSGLGGASGAGGGAGGFGGLSGAGAKGEGPGGGPGGPGGGVPAFGSGGGFGGQGGDGFGGTGGVPYGDLSQQLQGGSGGGGSGYTILFGNNPGGGGGGGGGGIELGATGSINFSTGRLSANGGSGGGGIAINAGGGSGGGLLLHALNINFVGNSSVSADGSGNFGGGGRITFLTASGSLDNPPAQLSVNAAPTGGAQAGVITYGSLTAVPIPAAIWLFGSVMAGFGLVIGRRNQKL